MCSYQQLFTNTAFIRLSLHITLLNVFLLCWPFSPTHGNHTLAVGMVKPRWGAGPPQEGLIEPSQLLWWAFFLVAGTQSKRDKGMCCTQLASKYLLLYQYFVSRESCLVVEARSLPNEMRWGFFCLFVSVCSGRDWVIDQHCVTMSELVIQTHTMLLQNFCLHTTFII